MKVQKQNKERCVELNGMIKLNIGCGQEKLAGFINIDKSSQVDTELCLDIVKGFPYDDLSVEIIHAGCVLEQLTHEQFLKVLNDCHRVLIDGGILDGYVPSTDPRVLHLDPMDRLFFQEDSFKYFVGSEVHWQRFGKNYGFKPWTACKVNTNDGGIIRFELVK